MRFIPTRLHLQKGDIITSKLGVLQKGVGTDRTYLIKKLKFIDKDAFECLGEKEEINVEEVK